MDVRVFDLVEDVDGESHLAAEGEGGDELRSCAEVLVEICFEYLGVDLLDVAEVCASVEVGEFLVEESPPGNPRRRSNWDAHLHDKG